jgi:hypothetical protein
MHSITPLPSLPITHRKVVGDFRDLRGRADPRMRHCRLVGPRWMNEALSLIKTYDPLRYRRLARDLKCVWVLPVHNPTA